MSDPTQDRVQALIDDLEKSIASFDERFSRLPADEPQVPVTPTQIKTAFPDIDPAAQRKIVNAPPAPAATVDHAPPTPLLSELAASAALQAEHVQEELSRRHHAAIQIGAALRLAADYLDQLTRHLNVLKPAIPTIYAVNRQHQFSGVHWQDSSTRSETNSSSERSEIAKLTLRVRLAGDTLSFPVAETAMAHFENEMYLMNLAWRDAGIVDLPGKMLGHRVEIEGSIPMQLAFTADIDQERIILRCRNFLGLGLSAYRIVPSALDADAMDTLGRCLLGRSKRLPDAFKPIAFNTPDSAA